MRWRNNPTTHGGSGLLSGRQRQRRARDKARDKGGRPFFFIPSLSGPVWVCSHRQQGPFQKREEDTANSIFHTTRPASPTIRLSGFSLSVLDTDFGAKEGPREAERGRMYQDQDQDLGIGITGYRHTD